MSLRRRISAGLGANAFLQLTQIGMQLASLPLFLAHWDLATYGVWLMLSALPQYLYMADAGLLTAAGNRMAMAFGRGDAAEARGVFQSALAFLLVVATGLTLLLPVLAWGLPLPLAAGFADEGRAALALLGLMVVASLFVGLIETRYRATGRYAYGTTASTLVHLGGWVGSMAGLLLGGRMVDVALGGFVAEAVGVAAYAAWSARDVRGLPWGVRAASRSEVRELLRPATSIMAVTLASALSLQSMTLLVGHLLGPAAVAVFNATRTLARMAVQGVALFSFALWPEFSRLWGQGGAAAVAPLYRRAARFAALLAVGIAGAGWLAAPLLLQLWTHGAVVAAPVLLGLLFVYAAVGGAWHVPRGLLFATNQPAALARATLVAAVLGLGLAYVLGRVAGLPGVALAMLVAEAAVALLAWRLAARLIEATAPAGGARPTSAGPATAVRSGSTAAPGSTPAPARNEYPWAEPLRTSKGTS